LTKTTTAPSTKRKKRNLLVGQLFLYENKLKLVIVAALIREGCASLHKCSSGPAEESLAPAIELFRHRFLHALRDAKLISPKKLANLLSWKHPGFNIDNGGEEPIAPDDTAGRERLAQYLLRHPFSLQKITWNATTKTVIYRSKRHHNIKRNFQIFKAADFIAAARPPSAQGAANRPLLGHLFQ
jgi:hypothetical protein